MAKKKVMNTVSTGLLVLLMLGLAGFGLTDFGGSVRTAATVGNAEITTNDFSRAYEGQINNFQRQTGQRLTPQQASAFGLERAALAQLVADAALENEAMEIGISVGDENVGAEIQQSPAFQGLSGEFDRATYELGLQQNGLSVADFEARVRSDISEGLLRSAVAGGIETPAVFVDTLFNYARETRDVTWARLTQDNLTEDLPAPTEAQLIEHHAANEAEFTQPETKSIRYAWLTPDMITGDIQVDETQLRALYDERIDQYQQPERRLVERLIFTTDEAASAAKARLDAGEVTFEDLVTERGLSLENIDLGDATLADLGAAGEAIFALTEPGAGSDAGAISSKGVVFRDEDGDLAVRLDWRKRYITLAAISDVLGLAFADGHGPRRAAGLDGRGRVGHDRPGCGVCGRGFGGQRALRSVGVDGRELVPRVVTTRSFGRTRRRGAAAGHARRAPIHGIRLRGGAGLAG